MDLVSPDLTGAPPLPARAHPVDKLGYRPVFDGLRAISILVVMGFHSGLLSGSLSGGFLGVDIFFVLSGFLITTLLLEEYTRINRIDLRAFYLRRVLRLLPALALVLGFLWIATLLLGNYFKTDVALMAKATLAIFFYASNWLAAWSIPWPSALTPMWSLALEEQFYLVWPLLFFWLLRSRISRAATVGLLFGAIAAVAIWRAHLWHGPTAYARCYFATDTRADAILTGCLFGLLRSYGWLRRMPVVAAFSAVGLAVAFFTANMMFGCMYYGAFTAAAFAAGFVIIDLADKPVGILISPVMVWIGKLSYGLYLWHSPVFLLVEKSPLKRWIFAEFAAQIILTFACATFSFYLVEQPVLRWKRRFSSRPVAGSRYPLPVE